MKLKDSHARVGMTGLGLALALTLSLGSTARAEITVFDVFKNTDYSQAGASQPGTPVGYFGSAAVEFNSPGDLTGAQVDSTSSNSPFTLTPSGVGAVSFASPGLATQAELDALFPNGTPYAFHITGGTFDGQAAALSTPATDAYASTVPFFTGSTYTTLQNFDPTASINLTFNPFTAAAGVNQPLTFIGITRVSDGMSVFGLSGDNTLSSAFVGANTLAAGTQYDLSIVYSSRIVTRNAGFGGAESFVAYDVRTDLVFTTAAAVPEPGAMLSLAIGGLCALGYRWRRRGRAIA